MALISELSAVTSLNDTDEMPLERVTPSDTHKITWANVKASLSSLLDPEPIGTVKAWDKSNSSTPALSSTYKECDGSLDTNVASTYYNERIENLNGANVVLTLTWTADSGGSYATVATADLPALTSGDDVSGAGIAASSFITDITAGVVTITDTAASGSISSTFTNDGLFVDGSSASGTGKKDAFQGHRFYNGVGDNINNQNSVYATTTNETPGIATHNVSSSAVTVTNQGLTSLPKSEGTNGEPRTDTNTYPSHRKYVMIKKIK